MDVLKFFKLRKPNGEEREVEFGKRYVRASDEEVVPNPKQPKKPVSDQTRVLPVKLQRMTKGDERAQEIAKVVREERIEAGNLIAAITTSTGFRKWWEERHGGECLTCQNRQAAYNYIQFQGPKWLKRWIHRQLDKDVS